jgi:hypothetical protein
VEAPGSSEVLVRTYQTAWCYNTEDHNLIAYFEIAQAVTRGKLFYEGELMTEVILSADSTSSQVSPCRLNKFTGFTVQLLEREEDIY